MPKLIDKHNKSDKEVSTRNNSSLLNLKPPPYDIDFAKTSVVNLYNQYNIPSKNPPNSGTLLNRYYKEYGYTALIATAGGYLMGTKSATSLIQSGLSLLVPGASRGGITSIILNAANIALRNPFIESTINNVLNLDPFNLQGSRITYQSIPPIVFLSSNPPIIGPTAQKGLSSGLVSATIKNLAASILLPTISGLANTGTLTNYDMQRAFGNSLNAMEIMLLSQQGIKYTKPVAWIDMTKPLWSNRLGNYFTYDKYIGYGNGLTYSKIKDLYEDSLEDRYKNWDKYDYTDPNSPSGLVAKGGIFNPVLPSNAIPARPSSISNIFNKKSGDTSKLYQRAMGATTDPNKNPEEKYSNRSEIREKINKLGFPQYNNSDAKQIDSIKDSYDKINMLDVGEDYNENLRDTIKFRIYDLFNKESIVFRAVLTGISDTVTPTWDGKKYLGRADSFYTYDSTERDISFTITVYAQSKNEIIPQWRKINRMVGLCYPTEYKDDNVMRGPIIQLTLGDLYNNVYGHFSSLTVSPDENSLWDIDDGYQLPMIVSLGISFKYMYGIATPQTKIAHFNHAQTKFNIV